MRDAGQLPDGERRPRRGRERWAKRWGQIERDDLDALVAEIEGDEGARDAAGEAKAWLETITRVAFAIMRGYDVVTEAYVVGVLKGDDEPARFGCVRVSDGRVVEVFQAYDVGDIDDRGPFAITHRERDWSAFGAARAFVDSVGTSRAEAALEVLRNRVERAKTSKLARRPAVQITVL